MGVVKMEYEYKKDYYIKKDELTIEDIVPWMKILYLYFKKQEKNEKT